MDYEALAGRIVNTLRAVLAADPVALTSLVEMRTPCGTGVEADSPAVPYSAGGQLYLGLLGVMAALVTDGGYRIVAHYADGLIQDFSFKKV